MIPFATSLVSSSAGSCDDARIAPAVCRLIFAAALVVGVAACGLEFDGVEPDEADDEAYIFDPSQFHHFDLEVEPADWQWLKDNALREEWVPAALVFEGERYADAAVRFKGAYGTLVSCFDETTGEQTCPKLSLKVSFNEYVDGRFFGLRKLVLNSSVRDPSLMREVLGYRLYREMGIEAPRASHATVSVNGEDLGVFVLVEYVDKEFVQDRYSADEGNLYKGIWPMYDRPGEYVGSLRTNEDEADVSRMLDLDAALDQATDADFEQLVEPFLELDYMARYLAVDRAISNDDGIRGFYCYGSDDDTCTNSNYYWYEVPDGPIALVPWDLDYTFGDVNDDLGRSMFDTSEATCTPIPFCEYWEEETCDADTEDVFLLLPQCDRLYGFVHRATWERYLGALEKLVEGPMSRQAFLDFADAQRDKIRDAVAEDPYGPGLAEFEQRNTWLDETITDQIYVIEQLLDENGR